MIFESRYPGLVALTASEPDDKGRIRSRAEAELSAGYRVNVFRKVGGQVSLVCSIRPGRAEHYIGRPFIGAQRAQSIRAAVFAGLAGFDIGGTTA